MKFSYNPDNQLNPLKTEEETLQEQIENSRKEQLQLQDLEEKVQQFKERLKNARAAEKPKGYWSMDAINARKANMKTKSKRKKK